MRAAILPTVLAAAVLAAACDSKAEPSAGESAPSPTAGAEEEAAGSGAEEGLIKIILQPEEAPGGAAAPIELLIELDPPAASDGWVEPLASEVSAALSTCGAPGTAPQVEVVFEVRQGALAGGEGQPEGELAACLVAELAGTPIAPLGDASRRLRMRVGDPVP